MRKYKKLLLSLLIAATSQTFAQNVGINTTTPDASAAMEINSSNKGLLIPRVSLLSVSDNSTIPSPAVSLLVYNTNASMPNGRGYYYNSGTAASPLWKALTTAGISIPYATTYSSVNPLFSLTNNSLGYAGEFISNNTGAPAALKASAVSTLSNTSAIHGTNGSSGLTVNFKKGILGESNSNGIGIAGISKNGYGVYGASDSGTAVYGEAKVQSKAGIWGKTTANQGFGVVGQSFGHGTGGYFYSDSGIALITNGAIQLSNTGEAAGKVLMTDQNGNANWEGAVAFSAIFSASEIPVENEITVPFNTEEFDVSNNFRSSSSILDPSTFIAPVKGIYQFDFKINWDGDLSSNLAVSLEKNGTIVDYVFGTREPNDFLLLGYQNTLASHKILKLNAGDKIKLKANCDFLPYEDQKIYNASFSGYFLMRQ